MYNKHFGNILSRQFMLDILLIFYSDYYYYAFLLYRCATVFTFILYVEQTYINMELSNYCHINIYENFLFRIILLLTGVIPSQSLYCHIVIEKWHHMNENMLFCYDKMTIKQTIS